MPPVTDVKQIREAGVTNVVTDATVSADVVVLMVTAAGTKDEVITPANYFKKYVSVDVAADIAARDALAGVAGKIVRLSSNGLRYIYNGLAWELLSNDAGAVATLPATELIDGQTATLIEADGGTDYIYKTALSWITRKGAVAGSGDGLTWELKTWTVSGSDATFDTTGTPTDPDKVEVLFRGVSRTQTEGSISVSGTTVTMDADAYSISNGEACEVRYFAA